MSTLLDYNKLDLKVVSGFKTECKNFKIIFSLQSAWLVNYQKPLVDKIFLLYSWQGIKEQNMRWQ